MQPFIIIKAQLFEAGIIVRSEGEEASVLMFYTAMLPEPEVKRKFERLYRQYRQVMYYAALGILKDPQDAEDAVHQAFLRLVDHLEKINENDCHKTRGFLVTIVENAAIDIYRHRKRKSGIPFDEVCADWPVAESLADSTAFARAFARLPVAYSTVLRLKYSHGYENGEIAMLLKLSEENVRQRLSRGKKKLARLLEEEGITV